MTNNYDLKGETRKRRFKLPEVITEEELIKIIKLTKQKKYKLAILLGFYECMRIGEITKLRKDHTNKQLKLIQIKQAKGNKDRDVPIMKPVKHVLRNLPIGLGVRSLEKWVKRYWPDIHFHTLRHSSDTFYLNDKGLDIRYIQLLLGHSNLSTTQIYTHVNPQNLKDKFEGVW